MRQYCFGRIVVYVYVVFLELLDEDDGDITADHKRKTKTQHRMTLHSLAAENEDHNFLEFLREWR